MVLRSAATTARRSANQIANAIDDGLAEVGLQPSDRPMLEALDASNGSQERILHYVFRIRVAACVARKSSARPAPDGRQRALDQDLRCHFIAALRPLEDVKRRIRQPIGFGAALHRPLTHRLVVPGLAFLTSPDAGTRDNESP